MCFRLDNYDHLRFENAKDDALIKADPELDAEVGAAAKALVAHREAQEAYGEADPRTAAAKAKCDNLKDNMQWPLWKAAERRASTVRGPGRNRKRPWW